MLSVSKIWNVYPRISKESSQRLSPFSPLAAQLLHNRGVFDYASARQFLATDATQLNDPMLLHGMQESTARLSYAIQNNERIGIFGDFDADGTTGTALMSRGLQSLGADVIAYIPHRILEGHGLIKDSIDFFTKEGVTLLITVDCGTTDVAEIDYGKTTGIDIIVTDHHLPTSQVGTPFAIINPQLRSSSYPFPNLSGVGLAFKLIQGLYQYLEAEWDTNLLQLVAIGTIADLVPLLGENRYLVAEGLKKLNTNPLPGLRELLNNSGLGHSGILDTNSVAFGLGPRINAPGRLDSALISYQLLMSQSYDEAYPIARTIEKLNRDRQAITKKSILIADDIIENTGIANKSLIMVDSEDFSPGVLGLLASRLVDRYYLPSIAVSIDGPYARGSCRSIPEFNVASALTECEDLFIRFGGHSGAAGFLIERDRLDDLRNKLNNIAAAKLSNIDLRPSLAIDAHVRISTLAGDNFSFLRELQPFGVKNNDPLFLTKGVEILESGRLGNRGNNLKLRLRHGGSIWNGVGFGLLDKWDYSWRFVDLVYNFGLETWKGSHQFRLFVRDIKPSNDQKGT